MTEQVQQPALDAPVAPDLGRWKIKRNLHYWVIGVVVAVLAVFMLLDAFRSENPDEAMIAAQKRQKEKEVAALNKTDQAPPRDDLAMTLAKQEKEAAERIQANQLPPSAQLPNNLMPTPGPVNLPPLPPMTGKPDAGLPSPEAAQSAQNQEILKAAQREEQIMASRIMAIDNGSRLLMNAQKVVKPGASADQGASPLVEERERRFQEARADRESMFNRALSATANLTGGGGAGGPMRASMSGGSGNANAFYDNLAHQETPHEVARPIPSRGSHALMQGATIPAVLITEIRSDLPGDIKAQTTMDVYDSVRGEALLIPKGTVLVGKYNSEVKMGQEKVMAGFTRLIYPSGVSVNLGGMKAAEASGESGVSDDVDNHFWKMFGTNFLIAGLAQVFQKDQGNVTVLNNGGASNSLSNTAGQILSDTVRTINERNRAIPPTIYVYRGHKFNVMVNKDMVLPPYETGTRQ